MNLNRIAISLLSFAVILLMSSIIYKLFPAIEIETILIFIALYLGIYNAITTISKIETQIKELEKLKNIDE